MYSILCYKEHLNFENTLYNPFLNQIVIFRQGHNFLYTASPYQLGVTSSASSYRRASKFLATFLHRADKVQRPQLSPGSKSGTRWREGGRARHPTLTGGRCNRSNFRKRVGLPPPYNFATCCQRCRKIDSLGSRQTGKLVVELVIFCPG
jgi:hypothetical protein